MLQASLSSGGSGWDTTIGVVGSRKGCATEQMSSIYIPVVAAQDTIYEKFFCVSMMAGFLPCRTHNPKARIKVESATWVKGGHLL